MGQRKFDRAARFIGYTVLVLSDVHGLAYAEITRLKSGTLKSRLGRGRARLRNSLEPVRPFFRSN